MTERTFQLANPFYNITSILFGAMEMIYFSERDSQRREEKSWLGIVKELTLDQLSAFQLSC